MVPGDASTFSELLPNDCLYLNSPRTSGCGGGLAIVFKLEFSCMQLFSPVSCCSFEQILFEVSHSPALLCMVICCPLRYNNNFLSDFSDLLADIMPKYDSFNYWRC